jgi:NAD(P)-dependent dehydrogenase (short-subunit alcohol dehydrogenase family)
MGNLSSNPLPELRDLTGCVAIVTGGKWVPSPCSVTALCNTKFGLTISSTGIGYFTVLHLARCGAKVYLGARNEDKAKAAIEKLQAEGLGTKGGESHSICMLWRALHGPGYLESWVGEVVWLDIDLTYPRKAKEAAEFILSREQRLDILSMSMFHSVHSCFVLIISNRAVNNAAK